MIGQVSLIRKRVANSPSLFYGWMDWAKIDEKGDPPAEVISHFDHIYRLEEVPYALTQVGFLSLCCYSLITSG
jgi:hypothetical protein